MKDYSSKNAANVLKEVEELIQIGGSYDFYSVCDRLSIFDWWPKRLTQSHLKQMRTFIRAAIKLGYDGYVCFKVGATGCANGMWAAKEPSTDGYSPDCDTLYRSFTPEYTYYSVEKDGKWYPAKEVNGMEYDSCTTIKSIENLIKTI